MIEILSSGALNTVQDRGRRGLLSSGVSRSGAMDIQALDAANALLGNDADAAAIEVAAFPFRLRFASATTVAVTGAVAETRLSGRRLPPWWAIAVKEGDELTIDPPTVGARVYVAIGGGVDVPLLLGARATELKSGYGGHEGRGLKRGDRLPVRRRAPGKLPDGGVGAPPPPGRSDADRPLRVLPAAEWSDFSEGAHQRFLSVGWRVTAEADRQGCRLDGPELMRERRRELLSHGIVPGTVQVPPAGRPIVQLAEANTCGGYPKIATVIEADLWRLGQAMPGDELRFAVVGRNEALVAQREVADWLGRLRRAASLYRVS
ncbi:biotin-dependent carboxyltransferase family protein [Pleomorphomonas sp. JP5]|uniref:5-oxoprolinase subunit C family protein n=1 Tax=Pleomorphomonas sp. JP5 TaxID=2942998 RepID=UPI0020441126|nr:biotin-dependent carboxyltransferase family protein [Pleomorphomonas sp. JP5]MCM5556872.1 biotin-dependent carboxyltransferase family protein [Pleomorphomonas sp. JP5]